MPSESGSSQRIVLGWKHCFSFQAVGGEEQPAKRRKEGSCGGPAMTEVWLCFIQHCSVPDLTHVFYVALSSLTEKPSSCLSPTSYCSSFNGCQWSRLWALCHQEAHTAQNICLVSHQSNLSVYTECSLSANFSGENDAKKLLRNQDGYFIIAQHSTPQHAVHAFTPQCTLHTR